jgi:GNAT superfamily N-acetyltransferase
VLRVATSSDSAQLAELAHGAYGRYLGLVDEPPAPMLLDYEQVAAAGRTYVEVVADEIQGMVTVERDDPNLILRNLAVRPSLQGHGIGRRLAEFVEQLALDSGLSGVVLWTRAEMADNIAFYRKLGYTLTHSEISTKANRVYFHKPVGPASTAAIVHPPTRVGSRSTR